MVLWIQNKLFLPLFICNTLKCYAFFFFFLSQHLTSYNPLGQWNKTLYVSLGPLSIKNKWLTITRNVWNHSYFLLKRMLNVCLKSNEMKLFKGFYHVSLNVIMNKQMFKWMHIIFKCMHLFLSYYTTCVFTSLTTWIILCNRIKW